MEYLTADKLKDGSYVNEAERNVHIWCSTVIRCQNISPKFDGSPTLGLIGGCYIHKSWVTVSVFYKWLEFILKLKSGQYYRNFYLFPCPDPRMLKPLTVGTLPRFPGTSALLQNATEAMKAGHYMLFYHDIRSNSYIGIWPELVEHTYDRRTRTASQTCTPSPNKESRDTKTRIDVRMRDRCCLVSGQAAVKRARGGNFVGLEVAHIFPLKGVNNPVWLTNMPQSARSQVSSLKIADTPKNAILLRADIHCLFDDYQWAVWIEQGKPSRVVRFEKSGAVVVDQYENVDLTQRHLGTTSIPSTTLLIEHFRVGLLLHVRGFGRRLIAGYKATLI